MNWVKGFALCVCLGAPPSVVLVTGANAAPSADLRAMAQNSSLAIQKVAMSDAEKKAKATDCSKQADAKSLHGEARRKFRETCKKS